jgi:hypothetical protein
MQASLYVLFLEKTELNSLVMTRYGEDPSDMSWKTQSETGNRFRGEWRQGSEDKSVTIIGS